MRKIGRPSRELRNMKRAERGAERSLAPMPIGVAATLSLGFAYLAAGNTGLLLAAGSVAALLLWSVTVPVAAGMALIGAGGVATLVEGDLTRNLAFATDRDTAATLIRDGIVIVATAALLDLVVTRARSPQRREPATSPRPSALLTMAAEIAATAIIAFVAWLTFGPDSLSTDIALAVERFDDGVALTTAFEGLDQGARAALLPVAAVAFGPASATLLGGLLLSASIAGIWAAARISRSALSRREAALSAGAALVAGVWPGATITGAMSMGFTGVALAGQISRQPGGVLLAGGALGLATLSEPAALLVVPLAVAIPYFDETDRKILPLAALVTFSGVTVPWWAWSDSHLGRTPLGAVSGTTALRLALPVVALALSLAISRRLAKRDLSVALPF